MTHLSLRPLHKVCTAPAAFALVALLALQGPAYAGDLSDAGPSIAVSYAELNLNSNAGAEKLYHRIVGAAERVCGPPVDNTNMFGVFSRRRCVSEAIARAVAEVDAPALTRYFALVKGVKPQTVLAARSGNR